MPKFVIRRIQKERCAEVHAFYLQLLDNTFSGFPENALRRYRDDWTEELIRERSEDSRRVMVIADGEDERLAGFLFGAPPDGGVATMIWLAVRPDLRGKGLGRRLVETAFVEYGRMGCHKVRVFAKTSDAVCFYKKLGMKVEGKHPKHWWRQDFWSLGKFL